MFLTQVAAQPRAMEPRTAKKKKKKKKNDGYTTSHALRGATRH